MPDTCEELFSIAVFPYLKTSGPVRFGPYLFRSTDDLEGLSKAQLTAVTEVTPMLYTQNNARVRSASYAVIPQIHVSGVLQIPEALKRVHSLVAYSYGTPNDQFGDPFLGYECATLLVLTPSRVNRFLIESEHHTILAMRHLCSPPYGANVASAGLFLGVFIAPRVARLSILQSGQLSAISQWAQDGIFRGKFIDLGGLHDVALVPLGEESSEWEVLLDEWDQSESYIGRTACLERANSLKQRVPVPPALAYREVHLREKSNEAIRALEKMDIDQSAAISKVESGLQRNDVSLLSWGAAQLSALATRMTNEKPLWTDYQIEEVQPHLLRGRQAVIQQFQEWLSRQRPSSETPAAVGDFKHKMLLQVDGNLKKLGLDKQSQDLEAHTAKAIRNVETIAEAHQQIRDAQSWLTANGDVRRLIRVAELRDQQQVGKEHASKLQGMSLRVQMPEIGELRNKLSIALGTIKDAETAIMDRARKLWKSKLTSQEDMETILTEVDTLTSSFESCADDLEDLQLMRRALRIYQKDYDQLSNDRLTWPEFENLAATCKLDAQSSLGEDEIPWSPEETIGGFVDIISQHRKQASAGWIKPLEAECDALAKMPAVDANRLYEKAKNFPAFLTESHDKRLPAMLKKIEARLDSLKIDWLVEKFSELLPALQRQFLNRISKG